MLSYLKYQAIFISVTNGCNNLGISTILRLQNRGRDEATSLIVFTIHAHVAGFGGEAVFVEKRDIFNRGLING
jgi:hypothetical protein